MRNHKNTAGAAMHRLYASIYHAFLLQLKTESENERHNKI
ncbi:hypothetical protein SDC9_169875 [bioreactor metagenome]|uniref:Uncharacterized protein n=1 Tax=bioreactor metagenome TaxID=1076179 RepID=A0A645G938_9ZZZZ